MRMRILAATVALVGAVGLTRADEKPLKAEEKALERADLDKRIVAIVYEAAMMGTDMFNPPKSDYFGCVGLYRGTLMAVVPMLDHRPKLQTTTKMRLERAAKLTKAADVAFELRTALDDIQNEIAPPKEMKKDSKEKEKEKEKEKPTTLWDRLGGEKGVSTLVTGAVRVAAEDPKTPFLLKDKKVDLTKFQQAMVALVSSASGEGSLKYSSVEMKAALGGAVVSDAEFDSFTAIVVDQLKKAKVADADIATLGKAWEGVRKDVVAKGN